MDNLEQKVNALEAKTKKLQDLVGNLLRANNAASLTLACVERFLDGKFAGWDEGLRGDVEARTNLLRRRLSIFDEIRDTPDANLAQLRNFAHRLRDVAGELGSWVQDAAIIITLYLRAAKLGSDTCLDEAGQIVAKLRADGITLPEEIEAIVAKLERKLKEKNS